MDTPSETSEATLEDPGITSYAGAIFPGSHHFTVAGGTFTNVMKNYVNAPDVPSDLRRIPIGDIDLQRQIRVNEVRVDEDSGVIFREARGCVRRVYSAKVEGRKADMTVAIYEGNTAEEEWRRDIAKYMTVRHPHILQVCGAASSGRIHATLFHGGAVFASERIVAHIAEELDLIPYEQFLDLHRHSPILTAYIHGYTMTQWLVLDVYCCCWEILILHQKAWSYISGIQLEELWVSNRMLLRRLSESF
ncbi:hypothetical protein C8F04DRAFT_190650 [Mycena alexandri]|uniref:Protein kinase domain-containing protein n=1 Tax=Mycena alexandri TaxID=1745969 RepID=A0AAD6WS04_9AGAR|nr:hypothetical protein C8F04DRAFT_190650 [Mycena alexandri]